MKLAVIGANGKAGKLIVKEAVNRGLDVTAVVRGDNTTVAQEVLKKDLFDLTAADLKGFDVVIDAFGAWTEETLPQHFKPLAAAMAKALGELRARRDVKWTYISPAGDFRADGARTGKYILGGEELTLNSKGESMISYADYAIAMVDEAVNGGNIQKRISVVSE